MRISLAWGLQQMELEVPEKNLIPLSRPRPGTSLPNAAQTLSEALERPVNYPPLWRALTPDDHVTILVDERLPQLVPLLIAVLEHVTQLAGVSPAAITLLCMPPSTGQSWLDELPDAFQDVRIEVHNPADRTKLAYLATTKQGRRVYLNRSAVDADQLVLLTRRGFDPLVGYSGGEMALYPGLADEAAIHALSAKLQPRMLTGHPGPIQEEAKEIAWLVGAPFFVQVIEGSGDTIDSILAGPLPSCSEGERLLNERWRVTVDRPADVVVATVTGDPAKQTIDDLARAFFAASHVVAPNGSIVLLSEITPTLGRGFEIFRQHDDPSLALRLLYQEKTSDLADGFMWVTAANRAKLYLHSGLSTDVAEELFTIPLQHAQQTQKLLTEQATCLFLPDAHKTLAVLR